MIFDNTDTPKATRLLVALTCKPLFQFLGSRKFIKTLSREDTHELLVKVERDLTHRFLCFGCTRLHPLRPWTTNGWRHQYYPCGPEVTEYWNTFKLLRPPQAMPEIPVAMAEAWYGDPADWGTYFDNPKARLIQWHLQKIQSHSLCWRPRINGPEIHFHEARQVLKRHNLGQPHGLPLSVLQRRFHFQKRLDLRGLDDLDFTDHFDEAVAEKLTQDFHESRASQSQQGEAGAEEDDGLGDPGACGGTLWTFTHEYDARVSEGILQPEGELLIRRRHRITGPVISADPDTWQLQSQDFARLLYSLELPVCRHLFCRSPPLMKDRLFEPVDLELVRRGESLAFAARYLKSVRRFRGPTAGNGVGRLPGSVARAVLVGDARTSRVHDADSIAHPDMSTSCVQCNTDLTLALSTSVAGTRWALELVTYHNLGDCARPDGKEGWGALNACTWTATTGTARTTARPGGPSTCPIASGPGGTRTPTTAPTRAGAGRRRGASRTRATGAMRAYTSRGSGSGTITGPMA
ncbi:hypothetical protein PG991_015262 [Apiospora marii]|uniref:Uncharacterized protein n=1 Tax=Apiospora marii TaxID=335849 RepID=A0ABR1R1X0_9PEZI